jgi:hypothetical protein
MGRHVLPLWAGLTVAALLIYRPLAPPGPPAAPTRRRSRLVAPTSRACEPWRTPAISA